MKRSAMYCKLQRLVVWVVLRSYAYEGDVVDAIFSAEKDADAYAAAQPNQIGRIYKVEEHAVRQHND